MCWQYGHTRTLSVISFVSLYYFLDSMGVFFLSFSFFIFILFIFYICLPFNINISRLSGYLHFSLVSFSHCLSILSSYLLFSISKLKCKQLDIRVGRIHWSPD